MAANELTPIHEGLPVPPGSYWVVPARFLAGCFPGAEDPDEHESRLRLLVGAGIRTFVNLMEEDETNHSGALFRDYTAPTAAIARQLGVEVRCLKFPIRDLGIPTREEMETILAALDDALEQGPVYLHCWGGVGRTGTVVSCWLLRHGHATGESVIEHLKRLRVADQVRGHRPSPETAAQLRFVRDWAGRVNGGG